MRGKKHVVGEGNDYLIIYDEEKGEYFEKPRWGGPRTW